MKSWLRWVVLALCFLSVSSTYAWKQLTITKSDTLAIVAEKYRPTGVSSMDMVIAVRNANPRVFSKASNFKPGIQLLLPTNAVEVRNAIKGKYPQVLPVSTSPSTPPKTSAVKGSTPVPKANTVKSSVPEPKANTPKSSPPPVAKIVTPPVPQPAKPVVKKLTAAQVAVAAVQTNMTIKSLQDTVSSQTQTIQDNQTQLNELTGQLNIANQQVQSLQAQVAHQGIWTLGNLWLVLWLFTLIMLVLQYRKNKQLLGDYDDGHEHEYQSHHEDAVEEGNKASTLDNDRYDEPLLAQEVHAHEEVAFDERHEPQLDLGDQRQSRGQTENWEQVELDIPIVEHQAILENGESGESQEHANAFEMYDDQVLAGEQNDIIQALSQDVDNMEWHQALLEFYVKTNSQNGFKRHYQNMVKSGLMTEGDPMWEEVRKMYLNKWIYQAV